MASHQLHPYSPLYVCKCLLRPVSISYDQSPTACRRKNVHERFRSVGSLSLSISCRPPTRVLRTDLPVFSPSDGPHPPLRAVVVMASDGLEEQAVDQTTVRFS